jgi:hypothetical protein
VHVASYDDLVSDRWRLRREWPRGYARAVTRSQPARRARPLRRATCGSTTGAATGSIRRSSRPNSESCSPCSIRGVGATIAGNPLSSVLLATS